MGPLLLLFVSLAAQASPSDTVHVSISSTISRALEVSPDVLARASVTRFAEARYDQARASRFLTEFTATSAHAVAPGLTNPNGIPTDQLYLDPAVRNDWNDLTPFNRLDIEAIQPLFTWGELSGTLRAARHGVSVEAASERTKRLEVAARAGELYYALVLTEALNRLTSEAKDVVERARREIRKLLDEGDPGVDDADLFQVQITEQEFNRRVVEVEQRLLTAQTALRRQLMLPEHSVPEPDDPVLEPLAFLLRPLSYYLDTAIADRPEPAHATAGLAARRALLTVAKSAFYPKLFLGVSAKYSGASGRYRQHSPYLGDPFLSRSVQAGFGLRMQLNVAQTRARVAQARAQVNEVEHLRDAATQIVLFEVEEAYRNLVVKKAAMDSGENALRISKEWLRTEQINFDLDLGDTENLVKAVQANLTLQAARHQAVYEFNVAVLRLLRAAGTLDRNPEFGT